MRCRSGASRRPPVKSGSRRSSRSRSACEPSERSREAASSSARGKPSSRRQISRVAASGVKSGRTARARSVRSSTASASGRESSGYSISPSIRNGARLVVITLSFGAMASRSVITGAASRTCSKLSMTSSVCRSRSSLRWCSPSVAAIVEETSSAWRTPASGTKKTPPGNWSTSSAPTCSDNRVFPVPPGPVTVTSLAESENSSWSSANSRPRPTSGVPAIGRFVALRLFSGAKSPSPSW